MKSSNSPAGRSSRLARLVAAFAALATAGVHAQTAP
eukprot:gene15123-19318_t